MNGVVDLQGRAMLTVQIRAESAGAASPVEAWIDTGFTGELVMPRSQIDRMGLKPGLMVRAVLADGRNSRLKSFVAWIDWFGESLEIEIVAGEGHVTLLGVGLMLGRRLVVDYGTLDLTLE
jgi:clan AA aspartic protease